MVHARRRDLEAHSVGTKSFASLESVEDVEHVARFLIIARRMEDSKYDSKYIEILRIFGKARESYSKYGLFFFRTILLFNCEQIKDIRLHLYQGIRFISFFFFRFSLFFLSLRFL